MLPDLEELRKNYEKFDDRKLIRLATEDTSSIRPEAVDLLNRSSKKEPFQTTW